MLCDIAHAFHILMMEHIYEWIADGDSPNGSDKVPRLVRADVDVVYRYANKHRHITHHPIPRLESQFVVLTQSHD